MPDDPMSEHLLPPILSTPGLTVTGVGVLDDGRRYLKLATTGRSTQPVREVVVIVATNGTSNTATRSTTGRSPRSSPTAGRTATPNKTNGCPTAASARNRADYVGSQRSPAGPPTRRTINQSTNRHNHEGINP